MGETGETGEMGRLLSGGMGEMGVNWVGELVISPKIDENMEKIVGEMGVSHVSQRHDISIGCKHIIIN